MKKLAMTIDIVRADGEDLDTHNVEHALGDIQDGYEIGTVGGSGSNGCGLAWKFSTHYHVREVLIKAYAMMRAGDEGGAEQVIADEIVRLGGAVPA